MSLRDHLVASRIAGDVATPRDNNLRSYHRLADAHEPSWFGLAPRLVTYAEVLATMAARAGVSADPDHTDGPDTIDADLTLDRLEAMAVRLAEAAARRERVFLASGHPAGLLAIHLELAAALRRAGATILAPESGARVDHDDVPRHLRYLGGVAVLSHHGELHHTHSASPMRHLLASGLDPDLVVSDHGWAGAAAQAGIDTVCFADTNDPSLFLGEQDGRVRVTVPLDDNVLPELYAPVAAMLVGKVEAATRTAD